MENTNTNAFAEQKTRLCCKCAYFEGAKAGTNGKCCHPAYGGKMEPVYGMLSSDILARNMRADDAPCGPDGRLFVADFHLPR